MNILEQDVAVQQDVAEAAVHQDAQVLTASPQVDRKVERWNNFSHPSCADKHIEEHPQSPGKLVFTIKCRHCKEWKKMKNEYDPSHFIGHVDKCPKRKAEEAAQSGSSGLKRFFGVARPATTTQQATVARSSAEGPFCSLPEIMKSCRGVGPWHFATDIDDPLADQGRLALGTEFDKKMAKLAMWVWFEFETAGAAATWRRGRCKEDSEDWSLYSRSASLGPLS